MASVRRIEKRDDSLREGLRALLADSVEDGASVGFLAPLKPRVADPYWESVLGSLGDGRALWVAEDGGEVVGTVQLELCGKENGRHRAELQKLLVRTTHRGRGIARRLLEEAERFARSHGLTLLVLDTEKGSDAESIYRRLGWTRVGEIPDYAGKPDGRLIATVYYYKNL
jgi:ribosomal protein S18 acetylase RimI-like enzyme